MRRLLVLVLLLTACSVEQHVPAADAPQPAKSASLSSQDRDFLERAAQGNNAEVAIGALVKGRSVNGAVISYGQLMTKDHAAAQARLSAIAAQRAIALPTSLGDHQSGFDRLVDRKGEEFDREFMKVMLEDHQTAVRLYQGEIATGVDPLLVAYAREMLPVIEAHLAHAAATNEALKNGV